MIIVAMAYPRKINQQSLPVSETPEMGLAEENDLTSNVNALNSVQRNTARMPPNSREVISLFISLFSNLAWDIRTSRSSKIWRDYDLVALS